MKPGDYVTATVRRPGGSIYDQIGTSDMTSEEVYYERGINLLHGFLTEHYVDDAEFIVRMPAGLKHLHVLAEPMSCATKAVQQAFEVQRRLRVWRPQDRLCDGRRPDRPAEHAGSAAARAGGLYARTRQGAVAQVAKSSNAMGGALHQHGQQTPLDRVGRAKSARPT